LALQLAPKEAPIVDSLQNNARSLDIILNVLKDEERLIANHIERIKQRISEFEQKRELNRTIVLQLMQSVLASFGAAAIYLSILIKEVPNLSMRDLIAVALTIIVWAAVPLCIYQLRLKVGSMFARMTLLLFVMIGALLTVLHLVNEVVKQ
jgi:hypothetical protein